MSLSVKSCFRAAAVIAALAAPVLMLAASPANAQVSVGISVNFGPPPLPDYEQPELPAPGYLWVPGYWAWDDSVADYYWVPGYWSAPPEVGLLWTPGYWGWDNGAYLFHDGYWGDTVGYYGGISYGFGYNGFGFFGGRWDHGQYQYNQTVNNVTNVTNVYNQPVAHANGAHTSFNGGQGGVTAKPTPAQLAAAGQRHIPPTAAQTQHVHAALALPNSHFKANQGKPAVAAVAKPGELTGAGVVPAKASGGPAPKAEPAAATKAEPNVVKPAPAGTKSEPTTAKSAVEKRTATKPVPSVAKPVPAVAKPAPVKHEVEKVAPKPALKPAPHPAVQAPRPAPAARPAPRPVPVARPAPAPRPAARPACKDPKKCP